MSEPKLPSEIEFASFLVYNPSRIAFPSEVSVVSRRVRNAVKKETAQWAKKQKLGERLRNELGEDIRKKFLSESATLVPMPGHAPMKDPKSRWAARDLCEEFVVAGLGLQWLACLKRVVAVPKAAFSAPEDRPSVVDHYDSLRAIPDLSASGAITVVDDFVTRGATLLAAVARLREAFPNASVRGFALLRTMSSEAIGRVKEPCAGAIKLVDWGTQRIP